MTERDDTHADADRAEFSPGTRLRSWVIDSHIATGGFGSVYRVHHRDTGEAGALKLLRSDLISSSEMLGRFEREAEAITRLHHPGVVRLLDFGRLPDSRPFLVMEYLDGVDLEQSIRSTGARSPEQSLAILAPLADALTEAHRHAIIHRDVKASNVMLTGEGADRRVVLLDFGVAKLLESDAANLTSSRARLGTPASMAPEQSRGEPVDARTDVYALGCVAYHLLTGQPPFMSESLLVAEVMHMSAPRPRPSATVAVARAVDDAVTRAMAISADDRFPSADHFIAALRAAAEPTAGARAGGDVATISALGLYVSVVMDGDGFDAEDDAVLDDAESIVPRARPTLEAAGLREIGRAGNSALFFRALPDDAADARAVTRSAIATAVDVSDALRRREPRDARVHVGLYLHVDAALVEPDGQVGGPLRMLTGWAHAAPVGGVVATAGALDGLDLPREAISPGEAISDDPPLRRVTRESLPPSPDDPS